MDTQEHGDFLGAVEHLETSHPQEDNGIPSTGEEESFMTKYLHERGGFLGVVEEEPLSTCPLDLSSTGEEDILRTRRPHECSGKAYAVEAEALRTRQVQEEEGEDELPDAGDEAPLRTWHMGEQSDFPRLGEEEAVGPRRWARTSPIAEPIPSEANLQVQNIPVSHYCRPRPPYAVQRPGVPAVLSMPGDIHTGVVHSSVIGRGASCGLLLHDTQQDLMASGERERFGGDGRRASSPEPRLLSHYGEDEVISPSGVEGSGGDFPTYALILSCHGDASTPAHGGAAACHEASGGDLTELGLRLGRNGESSAIASGGVRRRMADGVTAPAALVGNGGEPSSPGLGRWWAASTPAGGGARQRAARLRTRRPRLVAGDIGPSLRQGLVGTDVPCSSGESGPNSIFNGVGASRARGRAFDGENEGAIDAVPSEYVYGGTPFDQIDMGAHAAFARGTGMPSQSESRRIGHEDTVASEEPLVEMPVRIWFHMSRANSLTRPAGPLVGRLHSRPTRPLVVGLLQPQPSSQDGLVWDDLGDAAAGPRRSEWPHRLARPRMGELLQPRLPREDGVAPTDPGDVSPSSVSVENIVDNFGLAYPVGDFAPAWQELENPGDGLVPGWQELASTWQVADEMGNAGGIAAPRYLLVRLGECIPAETGFAPVHPSRPETGPQWCDVLSAMERGGPEAARGLTLRPQPLPTVSRSHQRLAAPAASVPTLPRGVSATRHEGEPCSSFSLRCIAGLSVFRQPTFLS